MLCNSNSSKLKKIFLGKIIKNDFNNAERILKFIKKIGNILEVSMLT